MKYVLVFGLCLCAYITNPVIAQDSIPELNQKVYDYVVKHMGKKVDRGECWDLAKFALDEVEAEWEFPFEFGNVIDIEKDEIIIGDIIQFKNVKFSDGGVYSQHTAIVFEVLGDDKLIIADQNFNNKRKVTTHELDLGLQTKGKITFYRPTKKLK